MYSIIACLVFYLLIVLTFIRIYVRGGNSFEYGTNLIFVSKNLLKPNSIMHKLYKSPNTLENQHIRQNALMRLISIILFSVSLPFSIVALFLLINQNNLCFIFDFTVLGILGLNLVLMLILIIWECIEGIKANKTLNKITNQEYQIYRERIIKDYPNFWSTTNK